MRIPGLKFQIEIDGVPWRKTSSEGVRWHLIDAEGSRARSGGGSAQDSAVLIEMDPGCGYPAHRHLGVEELLVLRGGYRDALGEYLEGEYVRYEVGSRHAPVAVGDKSAPIGPENPSCILFAIARGGIEVLGTSAPAETPPV